MKRTVIILSLFCICFCSLPLALPAATATAAEYEDPSPHTTRFKKAGIRFHYLDWGGQGEVMLFLTGLGNNAHIFDDIAPLFTEEYRVLALTRRGFGQSDIPPAGYDIDTLVGDLRKLLKKLKIQRVILVGHSVAGDELTEFASRYPSMVSALVYLDAAYDRSGFLSLPSDPFPPAPPTIEDLKSYDSLRNYFERSQGFWSDAQEADMRERLKFTSDGRVYAVTPDFVTDQILRGLPHADYTRITAPMLSIYSLEPLVHPRIPANASEADRKRGQDYWDQIRAGNLAQIEQFKHEAPSAHVIEMEDTDHYNFIQRRRFVAREIRSFLSSL